MKLSSGAASWQFRKRWHGGDCLTALKRWALQRTSPECDLAWAGFDDGSRALLGTTCCPGPIRSSSAHASPDCLLKRESSVLSYCLSGCPRAWSAQCIDSSLSEESSHGRHRLKWACAVRPQTTDSPQFDCWIGVATRLGLCSVCCTCLRRLVPDCG